MRTIEQKIARGDIIEESKYHPNKIKHIANNMPINICIIGSLSQANLIKKLAKQLEKENLHFNVKYVHKKKEPIETIIHDCFDTIASSHHIIAIKKPDNSFGRGTLYEIEFAKRIDKPIYFVNPKDILEK